jgi:hypothetical protein
MDGLMSKRRIFTVPNPDGEGRVRASFAGFAPDEPETIDDPNVVGGKRKVDRIWVRLRGRRTCRYDWTRASLRH